MTAIYKPRYACGACQVIANSPIGLLPSPLWARPPRRAVSLRRAVADLVLGAAAPVHLRDATRLLDRSTS